MFTHASGSRVGLVCAVLGMMGCDTVRYSETFYPEGDIDRIVVQADRGTVELVRGERLRVERAIRAPEGTLDLSHGIATNDDGELVLTLQSSCTPIIPCAVDSNIQLPNNIPVEVYLEQGDVWATGISTLTTEISRGDLDVDIAGPLVAQIGSGQALIKLPDNASATVAVGRGNITMSIPAGAWNLATEAADVIVDPAISVSPSAPGCIELIAPAGEVKVLPPEALAKATR